MRILVWGLGYVGTVSAACLAQLGHEIVGVEPNLNKVEALNAGHSAIKEPGLDQLVSQMVGMGRLRATQDGVSLLPWADMSLICVGTPAAADGSPILVALHLTVVHLTCNENGDPAILLLARFHAQPGGVDHGSHDGILPQ